MAANGFFEHWQQVAENVKDPQCTFANAIVGMKKYFFSKKLNDHVGIVRKLLMVT